LENGQGGVANPLIALVITSLVAACADLPPATASLASTSDDSQPAEKSTASIGATEPVTQASPKTQIPQIRTGAVVTSTPATGPSPKARYVVVDPGRSLDGIARENHVSPAALAAANHLAPPYKLKIGSRLVLPTETPSPRQPASSTASEADALNAQERSTLQASIAAPAPQKPPAVPVGLVSAGNGMSPPVNASGAPPPLRALTSTPATGPSPKARYVVVDPGRSLDGIARENHVSPTALAAANHLAPPYKLKAGSRLVLPTETPSPRQPASSTASEADALNAQERSTLQASIAAPAPQKPPAVPVSLVSAGNGRSPPVNASGASPPVSALKGGGDAETKPICDIVCAEPPH